MIRILLAIALSFSAAVPATAGAWMRGEGEGFLSFGVRVFETAETGARKTEQNLFVEYGLWRRLTVGASANYTQGEKGEGVLFLRVPLRDDDRPAKLAVELGAGAQSTDGATFDPIIKTGVSWGRGLTIAGRNGWVNVDTAIQFSPNDTPTLFKLDATVGITLSDRFQVMGQGFFETDEYGDSLSIVPSVIYRPKRGEMKYVVGLERKTGREESTGIRFGVWREF
jgi:hypothetical protein